MRITLVTTTTVSSRPNYVVRTTLKSLCSCGTMWHKSDKSLTLLTLLLSRKSVKNQSKKKPTRSMYVVKKKMLQTLGVNTTEKLHALAGRGGGGSFETTAAFYRNTIK